jgi:hypothetical protein
MSKFAGTKLAKGFKTDKQAEQNGVWRIHPEYGIHVRIRRSTLDEHKLALRKYYKPFQHLTRPHPRDELLVKQKAAAETLVADWGQSQEDEDGAPVLGPDDKPVRVPMTDADGNEIRPTQENVLEAFKEMPDFFEWVSDEADTFENYRVAAVEEAAGNSSRSSNGSANGEPSQPAPSSSDVLSGESQPDRSSGSLS